jgi:hypothetical protein
MPETLNAKSPDVEEAFSWVNMHLSDNVVVIVPENFMGFASIYSRSDLRIRVAPAMLSLNAAINLVENRTDTIYAIYFTNRVGENNSTIEVLMLLGNIGIYRITN